jgi:hypothetical protein
MTYKTRSSAAAYLRVLWNAGREIYISELLYPEWLQIHPPPAQTSGHNLCYLEGARLVADTRVDYILMLILRSFKRKATDIRSLR